MFSALARRTREVYCSARAAAASAEGEICEPSDARRDARRDAGEPGRSAALASITASGCGRASCPVSRLALPEELELALLLRWTATSR